MSFAREMLATQMDQPCPMYLMETILCTNQGADTKIHKEAAHCSRIRLIYASYMKPCFIRLYEARMKSVLGSYSLIRVPIAFACKREAMPIKRNLLTPRVARMWSTDPPTDRRTDAPTSPAGTRC